MYRFLGFKAYRSDLADYMTRWILILPTGHMLRLHHIKRADADPDLHDHPFKFVSLLLRGWYVEETPDVDGIQRAVDKPSAWAAFVSTCERASERRRWLSIAFRGHEPHRITEVAPGGCWTLVLTSPIRRGWGFWTPRGWIDWREYVSRKQTDNYQSSGDA